MDLHNLSDSDTHATGISDALALVHAHSFSNPHAYDSSSDAHPTTHRDANTPSDSHSHPDRHSDGDSISVTERFRIHDG